MNNMLVMTVLIAGAFFAAFYTPMLGTGAMMGYDSRPVDYAYFYRNDQNIPGETQVRQLAEDYGVNITSWAEAPMIRLAVDGEYEVERGRAHGYHLRGKIQRADAVQALSCPKAPMKP